MARVETRDGAPVKDLVTVQLVVSVFGVLYGHLMTELLIRVGLSPAWTPSEGATAGIVVANLVVLMYVLQGKFDDSATNETDDDEDSA